MKNSSNALIMIFIGIIIFITTPIYLSNSPTMGVLMIIIGFIIGFIGFYYKFNKKY